MNFESCLLQLKHCDIVNGTLVPDIRCSRCQEYYQFLEACHKIFEQGFLSHDKVTDVDCHVLQSIWEEYHFFTNWIDQVINEGRCNDTLCLYNNAFTDCNFDHASPTQKKFLAWQSKLFDFCSCFI